MPGTTAHGVINDSEILTFLLIRWCKSVPRDILSFWVVVFLCSAWLSHCLYHYLWQLDWFLNSDRHENARRGHMVVVGSFRPWQRVSGPFHTEFGAPICPQAMGWKNWDLEVKTYLKYLTVVQMIRSQLPSFGLAVRARLVPKNSPRILWLS